MQQQVREQQDAADLTVWDDSPQQTTDTHLPQLDIWLPTLVGHDVHAVQLLHHFVVVVAVLFVMGYVFHNTTNQLVYSGRHLQVHGG